MPRGVPKNGYPKNRKSRPCSEDTREKISNAKRGKPQSEQHKEAIASYWTSEQRARHSDQRRGTKWFRESAAGVSLNKQGYRILTMQHGHPLAGTTGALGEHRKVLYDNIGPKEPCCHWCQKQLEWRGVRSVVVCADHLDRNRTNNHPDNLVPSCFKCNWDRENPKANNQ